MSVNTTATGQGSDPRLYPLQTSDTLFYLTGHTQTGEQALFVVAIPNIVGVFFSSSGELVRTETRPLSQQTCSVAATSGLELAFAVKFDSELRQWMSDTGVTEGSIRVCRFFLPEHNIGIKEWADIFQDAMLDETRMSDDEKAVFASEGQRWREEGIFVLQLNADTDCWIDSSGCVVAT